MSRYTWLWISNAKFLLPDILVLEKINYLTFLCGIFQLPDRSDVGPSRSLLKSWKVFCWVSIRKILAKSRSTKLDCSAKRKCDLESSDVWSLSLNSYKMSNVNTFASDSVDRNSRHKLKILFKLFLSKDWSCQPSQILRLNINVTSQKEVGEYD